jgi:hypothetical protein
MFEALFDDAESDHDHDIDLAAAGAAAAAAPVPIPVPGPAAAPRRGGVDAHSDESKLRMKLAAASRSIQKQSKHIDRLCNANFESFSEHVAKISFGGAAPEDRKIIMMSDGSAIANPLAKSGERSYDRRNSSRYGTVSAVHAQAAGASKFLDNGDGTMIHSISSGTFDDSQHWVKDPASKTDRKNAVRCEGMRTSDGQSSC